MGYGSGELAALLAAPPAEVARGLLGALVSANGVTIRLTELEAYAGVGVDAASHAFRGRTARNAVMFKAAGHAYVYFTYGMHWCLNVVCGAEWDAAAVLLRAGAVVDGLETARRRRPGRNDRDLARGPACLCRALAVDGGYDGAFMLGDGEITLRSAAVAPAPSAVRSGPRVGVTGAADVPWRFWLDGEPTVSGYRRGDRRCGDRRSGCSPRSDCDPRSGADGGP